MPPTPLAILLSGSGRTLDNLLEAISRHELPARVAVVIASRECTGAEKARAAGMPTLVLPGRIPADRLARVLSDHGVYASATSDTPPGWVVLAGYLKLVNIPPGFDGRVVNIHPALLPKFGGPGMHGRHVHEAVLASGEQETGCTVHLCDSRFDSGPIVLQRRCPVLAGDSPDTLAARVFEQECLAYPEALRRLIQSDAPPTHAATTRESWGTPTTRAILGASLGGILAWSAIAKLLDPTDARAFSQAVLPSLSDSGARFAIFLSAAAEFTLAAWLASGLKRRAALIAFVLLMAAFSGMLALAASRGYSGSCGCFGSGSSAAGQGILRNFALALAAILGITLQPKPASPA